MGNYSIGLTAMNVAQQAVELIGTNIANAATEGYHRQSLRISPKYFEGSSSGAVGGGVEITGVQRNIDVLLEEELSRQTPILSQLEHELMTLEGIESVFGSADSEGLGNALGEFFASLRELAARPESNAYQEQAIWAASSLASHFRNVGQFIADLQENVVLQARNLATQVNTLTEEIADYNAQIQGILARDGNANILLDRRDQALMNLGDLLELQVDGRITGNGTVGVIATGMTLVSGVNAYAIETGSTASGGLGLATTGNLYFTSNATGGKLGGLLALRNTIIPDIENKLDTLATYVIHQVNRYHSQGVGTNGAFTQLTGQSVSDKAFSTWTTWPLTSGSIFVRVTKDSDGSVARSEITLTTANTIGDLKDSLDGVANISSSILLGALDIQADSGYKVDFLPALAPQPTASTLGASVAVSGLYSGQLNDIFTGTIVGNGDIGNEASLKLEIRNGANQLVKTLNVGLGYAAGDRLEITDGVFVTLASGTVANAQNFQVRALANSDTTGVLAAAGINTLFRGTSAKTIYVVNDVLNDSSFMASSIGQDMSDNANVLRMGALENAQATELGDVGPGNYYRQIVTGIGQSVSTRAARTTALETIVKQILDHRETVSGVDINEEAAKLVMFQNMFQAAAKFFAAQDKTMRILLDLM